MIEPNATMTKRLHVQVSDGGRDWMEIETPGRDLSNNKIGIIRLAHEVKRQYGEQARVQVIETITITTVKSEI